MTRTRREFLHCGAAALAGTCLAAGSLRGEPAKSKEAIAKGCEAPVILLTGHGSIDTAIESVRAGAFDYVAKPCPLDELDVRMREEQPHEFLARVTGRADDGDFPSGGRLP